MDDSHASLKQAFYPHMADPTIKAKFTPRLPSFIPHMPSEKQWAFLLFDGLESFFGGAGGPGKTEALLMAAAQYVDCPGYKAILIRRQWADFEQPEGLIPRMKEWWEGKGPVWNEAKKRWKFP